jgi:signal peptidase I
VFWLLFGLAVAAVVAGQVLGAVSMRVYTDPSTSMEPTIKTGDRLQVLPGRDVRLGDIIVFNRPGVSGSFLKRVIGLPGDRVQCCNTGNRVEVNGKTLDETYASLGGPPAELAFSVTLGPGQMWVMGDNRPISLDSRSWGPVPTSGIVGRVVTNVSAPSASLRTPATFVANGLAPPDHRKTPGVGPAALAGVGLIVVIVLAIFGTIRFFLRRRRSRAEQRGPGAPVTLSGTPGVH